MTNRILIDRLEFYITNVCNLTCNGCNRYNNYKFSGWQSWDESESVLNEWAEKIDIKHPVILGGEPLLNPDIAKWITGLRKLWPRHAGVQVQSNGTRINRVKGLYDLIDHGNWIGISLHNPNDKEEIFHRIQQFLTQPVTMSQDKTHPVGSDYQFLDQNKKCVHVWLSDKFVQSNVIQRPDGSFALYHSDPTKAHENCTFRRFKNYHMIRGKIYKCGPAALMPEFDQQNHFDISDEDRALLFSYQPLTADASTAEIQDFFHNIDNEIPQCKFCPENYDYKPITFSNLKKPWQTVT